jgi:carbamoyltransferase
MDLAASIQAVTEEVMLRIGRHLRERTGMSHLVLAGGVALNCVANGKLLRAGCFDDLWIQPAAGDAGGTRCGPSSASAT